MNGILKESGEKEISTKKNQMNNDCRWMKKKMDQTVKIWNEWDEIQISVANQNQNLEESI